MSCSVLACFIMKSLSVAMSNALKGGYCDEHKCGRFVSGVISTPESFQRIKEEEEANRPDPNWFAHLPPEKINAYMSKYPFKSFDDIPLDNSGLQYPSLQELEFYFPPAALAANCHQLPERMRQKPVVTMINGLTLLRSLGVQAFNIDPRRWHKIKTYLSQGTIEYPQMSEDGKVIIDGRHRILLIMQIYKVTDVPVFFLKGIS